MKTKSVLLLLALLTGAVSFPAAAQPIQPEVLFSFPNGGEGPLASLTLGPDGNFYGTTYGEGGTGYGTVFKVTTNGILTSLVAFNGLNGSYAKAALTLGSDGNFYGTTWQGGASGGGTVFQMTTNGTLTILVSFNGTNGCAPQAALTLGNDGNFYGTTSAGGSSYLGTVFKVTTDGTLTTLVSFNGNNGASPRAALTLGDDGNFYGTTFEGGSSSAGTVFQMTPDGSLITLASFDPFTNGAYPNGPLALGNDGNFYGTITAFGGRGGTVFQVTTSGVLTTLTWFDGTNGWSPQAALTLGTDGNFYGTTSEGGITGSYGTVFKVTPDGTLTTLALFDGANGWSPRASLTLGSDGHFYGTTFQGGSTGLGTVFKVTTNGGLTTLHSFVSSMGANPRAALTLGNDGNFYGTTVRGGGCGTVFRVTTNATLTTLVSFSYINGEGPLASLTLGNDGNFYGTAAGGGTGYGTVFKVTTNGTLTMLALFDGANGARPEAALTLGNDGNFYGTAAEGGDNSYGTVFKVTTNGTLTRLVSFNFGNGARPRAALTLGSDGNFYGITAEGGSGGFGTVFRVTTNGNLTTLVSFSGFNGEPWAGLTLGGDGNFYGTANGGSSGHGTVFKVTTNGVLTSLFSFNGTNGFLPCAALTLGSDGNFYGTTYGGGTAYGGGSIGYGTVFKVTTNGTLTTLVFFNHFNASAPWAALTLGSDGAFYGTTSQGGSGSSGTIFRLGGPPIFVVQPQPTNQFVPAGANATISADVFGTLPLSYQWTFNSTNLLSATNPTLTLNNVSLSMSGNYALQVSNRLGGPVLSSNALLTVLPALVTTLPASAITATSALLNASVTLGPIETLAWFEWGTDTNYGQIHGVTNLAGGSGTVTFSNALNGLDGDLIYHYRVVASNSFGPVSGTDQPFQVGVKPTAITIGAASMTTNSVAVNATVNPGGRSTMVRFQWGNTTNYGNLTLPAGVGHGSAPLNFSDAIAGLSLNTLYHCRVVASNSLGLVTGGNITFLIGAPLAVTEPATSVTGTNARLNGLVTPNLLPTTAWFEWGTNPSYGNRVLLGDVGNGSAAVFINGLLNGLEAAVTYHFRLGASNSVGGAFGADMQFSESLAAHAQSVLTDLPLVYYRFDETSGTTALNFGTTGAAGNGTYNDTVSLGNPGLVAAFGFAAGFNNSNSSIAVPALGTNNQVTLEVWAKPRTFAVTSPGNPPHSLYNSIYTADNYVSGALHTHFIYPFPSTQWQVAINPRDMDVQFGKPGWFPSNAWVHLAVTHDSPAHRAIAYINGRAVFTNNFSTTVPVNLAAAHIGNWIGNQNWFDGELDEFAIYGSILPAGRIQAHYQTAIGNPVLLAAQTTSRLTFSWVGPGFRLQSNTNVANAAAWINVAAGSNSPVSVTISNSGNRFFRLKWP